MRDYNILLVDQDHDNLQEMVRFLEHNSYLVIVAAEGQEAIRRLSEKHFDLVITELHMDPWDGLTLLKKAKEINPEIMVIIFTCDYDLNFPIDALRLGADDYLFKPFAKAEFLRGVNRCLDKLEARRRNSHSIDEQILNMLKVMSHDIRGPLVSMSAILKLLNRGYYGKMDEGVANSLNGLLSNTIALIGIVEEYLGRTLSIDGDLEIEEEVLDLMQDIINPVLNELSSDLKDYRILIDNHLCATSTHPVSVKGNKILMKTVLRNLLKNAIKYGDKKGQIIIGVEECGPSYRLNVYNNGRPIPKEYHDKLFKKFVRIGKNGNGNGISDGMGFGLYLTKTILQKHGGDIWYEPKEDGSNFVFTLPAALCSS